ncbi:MAG: hypothetical protein QXR60_00060 [Candidatus Nanoarchaeia archaeon]
MRTGKTYKDLHIWMDEYHKEMGRNHREMRHCIEYLQEVKSKWGDEGVIEYLIHVIADYKDTNYKLIEVIKNINEGKKQKTSRLYDLVEKWSRGKEFPKWRYRKDYPPF